MARLIGVPLSPFVMKIMVFCARKKIHYELEPMVPSGFPESFKNRSPLGKIPVWQEDDFFLPDSSCIALYLERKYPEIPLYPASLQDYGKALFLEEYADTRFMENAGGIFFEKIVGPLFINKPTDVEKVNRLKSTGLVDCFNYLETVLPGKAPVAGSEFSIADIALGMDFAILELSGEPIDLAPWPGVEAYARWVLEQDGFSQILEEGRKQLRRD